MTEVRKYFTHFGYLASKDLLVTSNAMLIYLQNSCIDVGSKGYFTLKNTHPHPKITKFFKI